LKVRGDEQSVTNCHGFDMGGLVTGRVS